MKLNEINTPAWLDNKVKWSPEAEKHSKMRFRELMIDLAHIVPGKFKPLGRSPYYLWAGSPEHGSMEITLMEPSEAGEKHYVYIKAKDLGMKAWESVLGLKDKGWVLKTRAGRAPGNVLHVEIQL